MNSISYNELARIELEKEIKNLNYELDEVKKTKDNNIIYQKKSNVFFLQTSKPLIISDIQSQINNKNKELDKIKNVNKKKTNTSTTTTTTTTTPNKQSKFKPNIKK